MKVNTVENQPRPRARSPNKPQIALGHGIPAENHHIVEMTADLQVPAHGPYERCGQQFHSFCAQFAGVRLLDSQTGGQKGDSCALSL